jgi:hypothetical protein
MEAGQPVLTALKHSKTSFQTLHYHIHSGLIASIEGINTWQIAGLINSKVL